MAIYTRQVDALGRHRIREQELRERLDEQRRNEEYQAQLESIDAPRENDSDWVDEGEDDVYAGVYADSYADAYADSRNGNGANGNGANGNGANGNGDNEGQRDPDTGEP